jgi:competence protein ComEC
VGASASVVRAAIMGVLGLFALQLGRPQTARLTALWTLFLMLAWNPLQLWYDAGFQLSFLALLGLIDIEPLLAPFFHGLPEYFGIRDALRLTIAAQIATVPWMLFLFAQLSLTAPVSNILAPPAVPYAMLLGFMSVIAGMLWFPLGQMTAAFASLLLQWIIGVASLLGSLPLGALQAKGTGAWFVVIYYVLLIGWMVMGNRHPKTSLKNAENQ